MVCVVPCAPKVASCAVWGGGGVIGMEFEGACEGAGIV